jgi:hypothetical protein
VPASLPVVSFLTELRAAMLRSLGREMDFYIAAFPDALDTAGWFTVVMAPCSAVVFAKDICTNLDTGKTHLDYRFAAALRKRLHDVRCNLVAISALS